MDRMLKLEKWKMGLLGLLLLAAVVWPAACNREEVFPLPGWRRKTLLFKTNGKSPAACKRKRGFSHKKGVLKEEYR